MSLSIQKSLSPMWSPLSTLFVTFLLLLVVNNVKAQSSNNQLIVYKDFFFLNSTTTFNYEDYEPSFLNDYGYAIAYQKSKGERKYRQYELKFAGVNSTDLDTEFKRTEIQLSYRRGKYWKKPLSENIRPRHSFASRLYFINEDINPLASSVFPIHNDAYGIGFDYLIGLDIKLAQKLNLLIDCSLVTVDFGYDGSIVKNPTLTLRQQKQGGFDFDLALQRVLKIGIGVSL